MTDSPELLLVGAVAAVGVLHTIVPDHWVPITLIARQRDWTRAETARAAFKAGIGHVLSTLAIASIVWLAGVAVAQRFGQWVDAIASAALVGFGIWIAVSAWRDLHGHRAHGHSHGPGHTHDLPDAEGLMDHRGHAHTGSAQSVEHRHAEHDHDRGRAGKNRTALLLILGSSPMVEGIPAFFAASKYGAGLVAIMSVVFGATTIATYVVLCVYSTAGLQRVRLGAFERHGEVLSGAFIALVGFAFWIWPIL
jgi:ABC-type nickel/cobalt efflux system permease component RcnA